jgi:hypothetical protein
MAKSRVLPPGAARRAAPSPTQADKKFLCVFCEVCKEDRRFMRNGMKRSLLPVALAAVFAFACRAGEEKAVEEAEEMRPVIQAESGLKLAPPAWLHGYWQAGPALPALKGKVFEAADYIDVGRAGTFYAHSLAEMLRLNVFTGFSQEVAANRYELSYETPLGRIREIFSKEEPGEEVQEEPQETAREESLHSGETAPAEEAPHIIYTYIKNSREPYYSYLIPDSGQAVRNGFEQAGKYPRQAQ